MKDKIKFLWNYPIEMEIVPDGNDVTEFFDHMVQQLHKMYGEEVLKARILHDDAQKKKPSAHMHG